MLTKLPIQMMAFISETVPICQLLITNCIHLLTNQWFPLLPIKAVLLMGMYHMVFIPAPRKQLNKSMNDGHKRLATNILEPWRHKAC